MRIRMTLGAMLALAAAPAIAADFCIVETQELVFGRYDATSVQPSDTTGSIDLRCTCEGLDCDAIGFRIAITGGGVSAADRVMEHDGPGDAELRYDLYSDPNRTIRWGIGNDAVSGIILPGRFGEQIRIPIFGRIPPLQRVVPGQYSDISQVVVTF